MSASHTRRSFVKATSLAAGSLFAPRQAFSIPTPKTYKAAVIGWTGRGDYGHGLDTIFNGIENTTLVAIADGNPDGLAKAQQRSGAQRAYTDYRQMLETEKPDLVSIASRQPHAHCEMALAAIDVGAHLYIEKPITEFPQEADAILAAAEAKGLKIAVAHTRRFMDHFLRMKTLLAEGYLGDVLDVRFQGKQDARVGGEDLIVLGSHDMDLMRWFWGDPQWCFATVTANGNPITAADIRPGLSEPYTVAGDTIHAEYRFAHNLQCRWLSIKAPDWNRSIQVGDQSANKWGFDIYGTKRMLSFQEDLGTFILDCPFIAPGTSKMPWIPIEEIIPLDKPQSLSHPIRNLINAIETGTKPQCSGKDARWAVEMVCAVYQSHQAQRPIPFPLTNRQHPLKNSG